MFTKIQSYSNQALKSSETEVASHTHTYTNTYIKSGQKRL